jgi:hypothetical protein
MGMYLIPVKRGRSLSYNAGAWDELIDILDSWGVDTRELWSRTDDDLISEATCRAVGEALQAHMNEIDFLYWKDAYNWKSSGGFEKT